MNEPRPFDLPEAPEGQLSGRLVYILPGAAGASTSQSALTIWDLCLAVWRRKILVLAVGFVFAAAGAAYALLTPEWFYAEVVVVPAEKRSVSSGLGQLGGLASLAGISLGSGDGSEPLAVLKSRGFVERFISDKQLLPVLFADKWDQLAGKWKSEETGNQPDIRDGVKVFVEKVRTIGEDKKSGVVTLGIKWKDPEIAAAWANELVRRLNDELRTKAEADATRNVQYLQQQMQESGIVTLQQSIGRVLEAEMQKLMLARGSREYAFKVIDPATVPNKRIEPKRTYIVILSAVIGGLLSIFWIVGSSLLAAVSRRDA